MKIIGYIIVEGEYPSDLEEEVRGRIDKDWQPSGGPFLRQHANGEVTYLQAMVKYDGAPERVTVYNNVVTTRDASDDTTPLLSGLPIERIWNTPEEDEAWKDL